MVRLAVLTYKHFCAHCWVCLKRFVAREYTASDAQVFNARVYLGYVGSANHLFFDFSMRMKGDVSRSGMKQQSYKCSTDYIYQQMVPQTRK